VIWRCVARARLRCWRPCCRRRRLEPVDLRHHGWGSREVTAVVDRQCGPRQQASRTDALRAAARCLRLLQSPKRLTFTPKRLLHEQKHFVECTVQCLHIVFTFRGLDQGAKVTEGGHLVHAVLRCVVAGQSGGKIRQLSRLDCLPGFLRTQFARQHVGRVRKAYRRLRASEVADHASACAGRPARSRWCKSTAMKE
jgi:hypothetical protein